MIRQDKPTPIASRPDSWNAFNDREVLPWQMCRADAVETLRLDALRRPQPGGPNALHVRYVWFASRPQRPMRA